MTLHRASILSIDMAVGVAASALLVVSLLIHLLTFWSFNVQERLPAVWLLHFGIFIFAIPTLLRQRGAERRQKAELVTLTSPAPQPLAPKPRTIAEGIGFPNWLTVVYLVLGFYVMVNFVTFVFGADGTPERHGDKFVLTNHGTVVREISREEYDLASAHLLHGFSGHWLIFYFYFASASFVAASKR